MLRDTELRGSYLPSAERFDALACVTLSAPRRRDPVIILPSQTKTPRLRALRSLAGAGERQSRLCSYRVFCVSLAFTPSHVHPTPTCRMPDAHRGCTPAPPAACSQAPSLDNSLQTGTKELSQWSRGTDCGNVPAGVAWPSQMGGVWAFLPPLAQLLPRPLVPAQWLHQGRKETCSS